MKRYTLRRRYGRAKSAAVPFFGGRCYACGAKGSGFRDRRPVRKGSVSIDDDFAHKSCHKEASGDFGPSPMRRPM